MKLLRSRAWRYVPLALAVAGAVGLYSCGAASPTQGESAVATPQRLRDDGRFDARASSATTPLGELVSRDEYMPILARPAFAAVGDALEADEPRSALAEFQRAWAAQPASDGNSLEMQFQLGRLALMAGEYRLAAEAFGNCSRSQWPLLEYCREFLAEAYVGLGDNQRALGVLDGISTESKAVLRSVVRRLRGRAAFLLGQDARVISELRADLADDPREPGWTQSALLLARALMRNPSAATAAVPIVPVPQQAIADEAIGLLRRVSAEAPGTSMAKEAAALEKALLAALSPADQQRLRAKTWEQRLAEVTALSESRKHAAALPAADALLAALSEEQRFATIGCETQIVRAKALAASSNWAEATSALVPATERCIDLGVRERLLFLAGKYAAADRQFALATQLYARLEREAPTSRYADDARLRGAEAYLELGDEAAFTRLLSTILDDYPRGDLALDGTFRLALRRAQQSDWAGAATILEHALPAARLADRERDQEYAGRERYFLARAYAATGELERGLSEFEALVRELPFSFYMQLAYARLFAQSEQRATGARELALAGTREIAQTPPRVRRVDSPAFERALALLRQGEGDWALAELLSLPAELRRGTQSIWAQVQLFAVGGSVSISQKRVREQTAEWLSRWPVGEWRQVWEVAFPRPHREIVLREAKRNELPESWIYGVMREESGFDARATSPANAYGLMQLIRPTAKQFAKELGLRYSDRALFKPATNIALGSRALRRYQEMFPQNPVLAIPGYNAGPGRPRRWLKEFEQRDFDIWVEMIPFTETRRYTKRVLASIGTYEYLYSEGSSWRLPVQLALPEPDAVALVSSLLHAEAEE